LNKRVEGKAHIPCVDYKITRSSLTDRQHFDTFS
jgi:hypothetical protein